MIGSLDDAWHWYRSVRTLARAMERLGEKYWPALPWEGLLARDNYLRGLNAAEVEQRAGVVLGDLDDLCVLLLFSVFEASVRERVIADLEAEPAPRHPALKHAVRGLLESIEHGSIYKVLEPYKPADPNLVEHVNQVRRYRNWVAHGRRTPQPAAVDPRTAYDRLRRFLDWLNALPEGAVRG